MSAVNNNNDQCVGSGEMKSNKKVCTSFEQIDVKNITEGIDSVAIQDDISRCAACGKEGNSDDMNICNKCKMAKYCNVICKKKHRTKHKKACERRVAELHDEKLFKQPPPNEDCPICFIRLPLLLSGHSYQSCCGKVICCGCIHAPVYDDQGNEVDNQKCPFCRVPTPSSKEEIIERVQKRIDAGDDKALHGLGVCYRDGKYGLPQDIIKALELWHRAAELGHTRAYCKIGYAYDELGRGVEVDKKKAKHYYELGAMRGDAAARHNLGVSEKQAGNMERALKHYMIAASGGVSHSLDMIKKMYSNGDATKEDYTKALQSYQEYLSEIKSKQRDAAAAAREDYRYY